MKLMLFILGDVKFFLNVVRRFGLIMVFLVECLEVEINVMNFGDRQIIYFSVLDDLSYVKSVNFF